MITDEEIEKYFKEHYEKKNQKRGRSINVPERLYRDFHKFCIDQGETMSEKIRKYMVKEMLENKKNN